MKFDREIFDGKVISRKKFRPNDETKYRDVLKEALTRFLELKYLYVFDQLEAAEEEKLAAAKADRDRLLTTTPNVSKVKLDVRRKVYFAIMDDIDSYGEDGFGDKPVHMDTVVYWLAHHDPSRF